MKHGRLIAATATAGLMGTSMLLTVPAAVAQDSKGKPMSPPGQSQENRGQAKTVELSAVLGGLNYSGASGTAEATVRNQKISDISISAQGVQPDAAHAVHVHYGEQALHECPDMGDASQTLPDGRAQLTTSDGVPYYGGIVVSLTETGDTSPASGLALDRFPVSSGGTLEYSRSDIEFTDVAGAGTAKQIADAVRAGEGVVVVHGVDYNNNGEYDFAAGRSDLTPMAPGAPAEATDPTLCGVLEHEAH